MNPIQPPPNYYGAPYPSPKDMGPQYPNMGPNSPYPSQDNNFPREDKNGDTTMTSDENSQNYFTYFLKDKIGKNVKVYCSFTDAADWHDKIFEGTIISSGDDYIILDEKNVNRIVLILSVYIHFIEIDK